MRTAAAAFALIALLVSSCTGQKPTPDAPADEAVAVSDSGYRLVGEFEPMAGVWLGAEPDDAGLMQVTSDLARVLSPHASITIVAADEAAIEAVRAKLQAAGIDANNIEFHAHEQTQFFIRDAGALFAVNGAGEIAAVDFRWSTYGIEGWCRVLYPDEEARAAKCASYGDPGPEVLDAWMGEVLGGKAFPMAINLEGGAIEANGRGTVIVSSVLAKQRNPGRSIEELEEELRKLPGVTNVVWVEHGLAEDSQMASTITGNYVGYGTGGHTDEFVRFADAGTILLAWVDEGEANAHPVSAINRARMTRNLEILAAARDQDGAPFRIIKTPMPRPIEKEFVLGEDWTSGDAWTADTFPAREGRAAGDTITHVAASSYLNYVIANDIVVIPTYLADGAEPAAEEKVVEIFKAAFPGREIARVPATTLNWLGGGLHCVTASEPEHGG